MTRLTLLILVLLSTTGWSQAPKFKMSDLGFMAGEWKATSSWGEMEEFWSTPSGNCMMCTFRCVKEGKVLFYEFVLIEQLASDSLPVMRLRHFDPGSIGREDEEHPYLYPLVSLTLHQAVFESRDKKTILSYELIERDKLKAVLVQDTNGKRSTTEFLFGRVR